MIERNSENVLDVKFWKKENQPVVSRSRLILVDYTKRMCVGMNRLQNKNEHVSVFIQ